MQMYSDKVIDHYENPRNVGKLDKNAPDVGTGLTGAPACGDVMQLQIRVSTDGIIEDAKFKTYGCGSAIASSSLLTEWVRGKSLDEAGEISNVQIAQELSLAPVKHTLIMKTKTWPKMQSKPQSRIIGAKAWIVKDYMRKLKQMKAKFWKSILTTWDTLLLVLDTWSQQKMKSLESLPGQPLRLREVESSSIETFSLPLRTAKDFTDSGTTGQKRFNS